MTNAKSKTQFILAVYPSTRGFGFAVFDGPKTLVDWGTKAVQGDKNKESLLKIKRLIAFYQPDVLVVEENAELRFRRSRRIRQLTKAILTLASKMRVQTASCSRLMVREVFSEFGAKTKEEIAHTIAHWLPELEPRLPPVRKIWMSEDPRMNIFDAVALALTFFALERKKEKS